MKIYVIIYQEEVNYSCGDKQCGCGSYSTPCVIEKAFKTTEEANEYIDTYLTLGKDWHYEIKELSL